MNINDPLLPPDKRLHGYVERFPFPFLDYYYFHPRPSFTTCSPNALYLRIGSKQQLSRFFNAGNIKFAQGFIQEILGKRKEKQVYIFTSEINNSFEIGNEGSDGNYNV